MNFEEKGVSPVVGTILLVALTVLAAGSVYLVINQLGTPETAPTATISIDEWATNDTNDEDNIRFIHEGGDTLESNTLNVTVNGERFNYNVPSTDISAGENMTVENTEGFGLSRGDTVKVIHDASGSVIFSGELKQRDEVDRIT